MAVQRSTAARDASNNGFSTTLGTSGVTLVLYTGGAGIPANPAASALGNVIVTMALPSSPLAASSGGVISKSASTWSGVATLAGTNAAAYYRLINSTAACVEQGLVFQASTATTSASTAAHGNTLTFAGAPGVVAGQTVSGVGIPLGTFVESVSGTSVTMSKTSLVGVASGAVITFGGDMTLDNVSIAQNQNVQVNTYAQTASDA